MHQQLGISASLEKMMGLTVFRPARGILSAKDVLARYCVSLLVSLFLQMAQVLQEVELEVVLTGRRRDCGNKKGKDD